MNYRITEVDGWVVVNPSGKAQTNEPLRVRYLFKQWLAQNGIRVIVNLKEFSSWAYGKWGSLRPAQSIEQGTRSQIS
ncbi:MAG TPA: hypothetical protein VMO00_10025 [Methylomirabilota bacterium]|nr:hypothetical protein [Methylomirabilota bacterium]